jgi:hypothetical protein
MESSHQETTAMKRKRDPVDENGRHLQPQHSLTHGIATGPGQMNENLSGHPYSGYSPMSGFKQQKRFAEMGGNDIGVGGNAGVGNGVGLSGINYLTRARTENLLLVEGDSETFGDVLEMLDSYEGQFHCRTFWVPSFYLIS